MKINNQQKFKTVKLYKKDTTIVEALQKAYLLKHKTRIPAVAIVSKLLAHAKLEDIE